VWLGGTDLIATVAQIRNPVVSPQPVQQSAHAMPSGGIQLPLPNQSKTSSLHTNTQIPTQIGGMNNNGNPFAHQPQHNVAPAQFN